jgi:hypothetical protein
LLDKNKNEINISIRVNLWAKINVFSSVEIANYFIIRFTAKLDIGKLTYEYLWKINMKMQDTLYWTN